MAKARIDQGFLSIAAAASPLAGNTSHQAIATLPGQDDECAASNLRVTIALPPGTLDERTGKVVEPGYANWTTHPNNPMAKAAE